MSREVRFILALFAGVMGLGLIAFGILRGATDSGPANGVRLQVAIAPPLDASAVAMAETVARDRVEEKGANTRVVPAGDHLIVELGDTTPDIIAELIALLERTATVEIRSGGSPVVDPRVIASAYIDDTGVEILGRAPDAFANVRRGETLELVIDGKLKLTTPVDRASGGELHLAGGGLGSDTAGFELAHRILSILELGAVHPLHVTDREPFSRATGFIPRAWPFAVPGLVLLVLALALGVARRAKRGD